MTETVVTPATPLTVMLDSDAMTHLVDDPAGLGTVRAAVDDGRLRLLVTHIQDDELGRIKDPERHEAHRAARIALGGHEIATTGFVISGEGAREQKSRLDNATLAGDADEVLFYDITNRNLSHAEDGLLALTARDNNAVLVLKDVRSSREARKLGVTTMHPAELVSLLHES